MMVDRVSEIVMVMADSISCHVYSDTLPLLIIIHQFIYLPLCSKVFILIKTLSFWCSPLHVASIALLSVLGEGPSHVALWVFVSSFSLLLLKVKGRGCHTLLKPYETNCDSWIGFYTNKIWLIDWLIDWLIREIDATFYSRNAFS